MAWSNLYQPLRRLLNSFCRLQWKITLTYTLFTVGTILLLQSLAVLAGAFFLRDVRHSHKTLMSSLQEAAPKVAAFMQEDPMDKAGLAVLLRQEEQRQRNPYLPLNSRRRANENRDRTGVFYFSQFKAVVAPDGSIIASSPRLPPSITLDSFAGAAQAETILAAALTGEEDPSKLSLRGADGSFIGAMPVFDARHMVIGALLYVAPKPPGIRGMLLSVLNWRNAIIITLVAGLVGALFGFITAGWLTRRLRVLAEVTNAWGQGGFSVRVPDTAKDELGALARQLNVMAGQLEGLLALRERLAVMEERNRLARDLHDSVTQALYSSTLYAKAATRQLSAGEMEKARAHLAEMTATTQQALREMRLLIHELRPSVLGEEGLAAALRDRLDTVEARAGLKADFQVEGELRLAAEMEEGLYHIAQEALNNALKHAQPKQVAVKLRQDEAALTMEISDDGEGFDPEEPKNQRGLGLRNMAERAVRLGGRLEVRSQRAGGTTVRVEVGL